ncbi:putative hexose transport-related protein [Meredithblackwellia eburnea MCA 4105]
MGSTSHAPSRDEIPSLESFGVQLHPDTHKYVNDPQALADAIGGNSIRDVFANPITVLAAFAASCGGLLFGFDQGILSLVYIMPAFLKQFPDIDTAASSSAALNKGVMTGLLELGAAFGAMSSGFLADRYSRKKTIAFGTLWFVLGSVLQASAFGYAQLTIGRFIGGIGIGTLASTAPLFISEIAAPNIRGALLAMEGSTIVIGIVIMFYITYGSRYIAGDWAFRLPFTIQIAPSIVLALILWRMPYSPRWLVEVGRDADALDSLSRLRGLPTSSPLVQAEWIGIRAEAIRSREVIVIAHPHLQDGGLGSALKLEVYGWIDMFRTGMLARTYIGIMLMIFQQFQGINALIYYSPTLFQQLGLDTQMQIDMSGVLNIVQMVATCSAFFVLDKAGRKPPLLIGSFANSICHIVVAVLIAKFSSDWAAHAGQAWAAVGFLFAFMFFFGIGWSPVPWALPAEVFSSSRRAKGVAISVTTNWIGNFIIGLITPPMLQNAKYGTFIFFGFFSVVSGIWVFFFCPETKGKTLEDIDSLFNSKAAREDSQAHYDLVEAICTGNHPGGLKSSKGSEQWVEESK